MQDESPHWYNTLLYLFATCEKVSKSDEIGIYMASVKINVVKNEHNFHSYRMWDTSWRIIRRVGRRAVVGHFGRMDQVWYGKRSVYRKDCSSARGVGRGKIKASNLRRMGL
jgi:hypothetical protein